jgi:hypothetical protein
MVMVCPPLHVRMEALCLWKSSISLPQKQAGRGTSGFNRVQTGIDNPLDDDGHFVSIVLLTRRFGRQH